MESRAPHRGLVEDKGAFAERFVLDRLAGFQKDMDICLTGAPSKTRKGLTHAYFPALAACCGTLEYMAGLYKGRLDSVGWRDVARWANFYLPQPDYAEDVVRVFVEAFRNSIAHRGIASGVWIDRKPAGAGNGRRFTWRVLADRRRPSIRFVEENRSLLKDTPWACPYTHRAHIHLGSLCVDIREAAVKYAADVRADQKLTDKFFTGMNELYPQA